MKSSRFVSAVLSLSLVVTPALAQQAQTPVPAPEAPVTPAEATPAQDPAANPAQSAPTNVPMVATQPSAQDSKPGEAKTPELAPASWSVFGYVRPTFTTRYRPLALPRDKWDYGFGQSEAGLGFSGSPFPKLSFSLQIVVDPAAFSAVTSVRLADRDGDGSFDSVRNTIETLSGALLDTATVTYAPWTWLAISAGQMRIPFTIPQRSANTQLMFPDRAGPNQVFIAGSDQGGIITGEAFAGRFITTVGVFNGSSLGLLPEVGESRGLTYAARADINPFGKFSFNEGDVDRGPFRIGIGAGLLFRPGQMFDASGYEFAQLRDFRFSASLRLAVRGFYFQAEYLRRQRTDSLTSRPLTATGAYAQTSYFLPVASKLAISPIARIGYAVEDEFTQPRAARWYEAGLKFYPVIWSNRPNDVRFTIFYFLEKRVNEAEDAHGASVEAMLVW